VAFEVGDADSRRRELAFGCIHGNEGAGVAVVRKLEGAGMRMPLT
jgi:succinylglutamate desuccinylase